MTITPYTKRGETAFFAKMPEREAYRVRKQEQYIAFAALQQSLEDAVSLLTQPVDAVTARDCREVGTIVHEVQHVVQGAIARFEGRGQALGVRPYPLLLKLWSLHRELVEAQVLVGNVRGLCASGRLATDFTGAFWHLRHYLKKVIRGRRELLGLLLVEAAWPEQLSAWKDTSGKSAVSA